MYNYSSWRCQAVQLSSRQCRRISSRRGAVDYLSGSLIEMFNPDQRAVLIYGWWVHMCTNQSRILRWDLIGTCTKLVKWTCVCSLICTISWLLYSKWLESIEPPWPTLSPFPSEDVQPNPYPQQVHILSVVPPWICISDHCKELTNNMTYQNKSIVSD